MEKICCICKKTFIDYGNNAYPIKEGVCCNECNSKFVIPVRIFNWSGASFEVAKNPSELKNLEEKLNEKNFEQMSEFQNLKRFQNVETEENVVICII